MADQRWTFTAFSEYPEILDDNVLLDPLEENLNIPSVAIKVGYLQRTDIKVIGYKIYNGIIFRVIDSDKSHILGIEFA